uniref:Uncharacterized protein n=1 Tax=Acrobeloides nanus TaxID=290746 RepID=A0A914EM18_9BILA
MRHLFIRMNNGQYLDGQGLSVVKADINHTEKGCPCKDGADKDIYGQDGADKGCPWSKRTSSETDKAHPRLRRTSATQVCR